MSVCEALLGERKRADGEQGEELWQYEIGSGLSVVDSGWILTFMAAAAANPGS